MRAPRVTSVDIDFSSGGLQKMTIRAKNDAKRLKRLRIAVARQFGLPTYKHVNLEKTIGYLKYRESVAGKIEAYLDDTLEKHLISDTGARRV